MGEGGGRELKIRQTNRGKRRQLLRRLTNLLLYRHFAVKLFSLKERNLDHPFLPRGTQLEPVNGTGRWLKDLNKRNRSSAPPSLNGPLYYRPNRMHQYLSATELRDAAENEEALRYGRPTRTT